MSLFQWIHIFIIHGSLINLQLEPLCCVPMQQDTIKWVYNNSESAQEDNQKTNRNPAPQENGDGFECKVEGEHTHKHFTHAFIHSFLRKLQENSKTNSVRGVRGCTADFSVVTQTMPSGSVNKSDAAPTGSSGVV